MKQHRLKKWLAPLLLCLLTQATPLWGAPSPSQKLMLVGGGKRPPAAVTKWLGWSQEYSSVRSRSQEILVIAWASEIPEETAGDIEADLLKGGARKVVFSYRPPVVGSPTFEADKKKVLDQLDHCTGVFWSGGNQNLHDLGLQDPEIRAAFQKAYWGGMPMAGTSAGCTLMSDQMLIGVRPGITAGLGFLPRTVIDMHFIKRDRFARLHEALKLAPPDFIGLGVDEDGSILFESEMDASGKRIFKGIVVGDKQVVLMNGASESLLDPGHELQWEPEGHAVTVSKGCDLLLKPVQTDAFLAPH